jgi:hypothetical protein
LERNSFTKIFNFMLASMLRAFTMGVGKNAKTPWKRVPEKY